MQEQKIMEKLYILCGLSNEAGNALRSALAEKAGELGYEAVCVSRYRKEGIRQYISEHPEFRILVLQEAMQSNYPYEAEELAELMDDYHLNIIISINKSHRANQYMKVLYTAGILNALYEEDATAENILKRILYPRTRRECRSYYQITTALDAMSALEVVDKDRMHGYLTYIEDSKTEEEILKKYHYAAKTLKTIENVYLAQNLSQRVKNALVSDEIYNGNIKLQEKKKRWNFRKKVPHAKSNGTPKTGEQEQFFQTPVEREGREKRSEYAQEHEVVDMIDEDISDLLGFGTGEKELGFQTELYEPVKKTEPEKTAEAEWNRGKTSEWDSRKHHGIKRKNGWNLLMKSLLLAVGLLFLAATILFGFFLYSEQREKETSVPIVSQLAGIPADEKAMTDDQAASRKKETAYGGKEKTDEEYKEKADIAAKEPEKPADTKEKEQRNPEAKEQMAVDMPVTAGQPVEVQAGQAAVQAGEIAAATDQQSFPQEETAGIVTMEVSAPPVVEEAGSEEQPVSYQGKIFTGDEVAQIARQEEGKGHSLYLKTREAGEGIFSADVIAGMVDGSCSYLAENGADGQISFIQL